MLERDATKRLSGRIEIDDAYLGGERSGGKRGRGAPGKTPFVAAVWRRPAEGEGPVRLKLRRVLPASDAASIAGFANRSLDPDCAVVSDGLPVLSTSVTACRVLRIRSSPPGQDRKAARTPAFKWVNTALGNGYQGRHHRNLTAPSTASMSRATSPNSNTASIGRYGSGGIDPHGSLGPPFEPRRCLIGSSNWLRFMRNQVHFWIVSPRNHRNRPPSGYPPLPADRQAKLLSSVQ